MKTIKKKPQILSNIIAQDTNMFQRINAMEKLEKASLIFRLLIKTYQLNRHIKYLKFAEEFMTRSKKIEASQILSQVEIEKRNIQEKLKEKQEIAQKDKN